MKGLKPGFSNGMGGSSHRSKHIHLTDDPQVVKVEMLGNLEGWRLLKINSDNIKTSPETYKCPHAGNLKNRPHCFITDDPIEPDQIEVVYCRKS
jgi:hypothetical protein